MKSQSWKNTAVSMLTAMRVLFISTITIDFFLTVISKSARSLVFTGLGAGFAPFIIIAWGFSITIILVLMFEFFGKEDSSYISRTGYYAYGLVAIIYAILTFLAFFNPAVAFPIVLTYFLSMCWSLAIMYYRRKVELSKHADVV